MPNLTKRPGSPFWYARFQHKGKDIRVSTEESHRSAALAKLPGINAKAKIEFMHDVSTAVALDYAADLLRSKA